MDELPGGMSDYQAAKRAIDRCRKLASFSEDPGGTRRTFLSAPMRDCHREIAGWLESLGVQTRIDAAGNLRGFYAGEDPEAPRLLIGSHLDTVPDAGAFDGVLGVVLGVALIEGLGGKRLPFGIEVVGFSEEEGVRFGVPFIGSRALVGRLDEDLLSRQDKDGVSVRQAIEGFGLDARNLPDASVGDDVLGYVEFHIEQGPILEELGCPLGAVEAVAGQSRLEFIFVGRANHAGTTPMHLRHDAIAAAAEWITAVEHQAQRVPGLLATVGTIAAMPGAANVIAGQTRVTLDVRHRSDEVREREISGLIVLAEEIAKRRMMTVQHRTLACQSCVPLSPSLLDQVEEAIRRTGAESHRMVSGAGHDAMILAEKMPAALIFLRTPGGVSHSPSESVLIDDVAKAIEAGSNLLGLLASTPAIQRRTDLA